MTAANENCTCTFGREIGGDSAGHCCWPGQAWVPSRSTCVGLPTRCPEAFTPVGDTCEHPLREAARLLRGSAGVSRSSGAPPTVLTEAYSDAHAEGCQLVIEEDATPSDGPSRHYTTTIDLARAASINLRVPYNESGFTGPAEIEISVPGTQMISTLPNSERAPVSFNDAALAARIHRLLVAGARACGASPRTSP
jgi:hypothetical protein